MKFSISISLLVGAINTSCAHGVMPDSFDCEWRKLALTFASSKVAASANYVYEALELGLKCWEAPPSSSAIPAVTDTARELNNVNDDAIFVDPSGDDSNKGSFWASEAFTHHAALSNCALLIDGVTSRSDFLFM